ncbi:MAG: DUF6516 family protein [Pseudomonadota bacterium]
MKKSAVLLYREKRTYAGGIIEMVIWQVPEPVSSSEHPFKYRFVFVRNGQRLVGYNNERCKGDHRHLGSTEASYTLIDETRLLEDFWLDVKEATK